MLHPAKPAHWDGSGGDETVIVQVIGEGPATATPVDSARPFWIERRIKLETGLLDHLKLRPLGDCRRGFAGAR
jgi:hypothetical protein